MWLKEGGLKSLINEWWHSVEIRGSGSFVLTEKLKALKIKLGKWNKDSFRRVEGKGKGFPKKSERLGQFGSNKTPFLEGEGVENGSL